MKGLTPRQRNHTVTVIRKLPEEAPGDRRPSKFNHKTQNWGRGSLARPFHHSRGVTLRITEQKACSALGYSPFQSCVKSSRDATPLTLTHSTCPSLVVSSLPSSPAITSSPSFVQMLRFCHSDLSAPHDARHLGAPSLVFLTSTRDPAINFSNSGHRNQRQGSSHLPLKTLRQH